MPSLRNLLVTVLCALLALGAAPLRNRAACGSDAGRAAAPSCCQPRACCCGGDARGACGMQDCGNGERRAPAPTPAPKPVQVDLARGCEPRPVRVPTANATADARAALAPRANRALGFRALPQRLRQEALSVWRC